MNESEFKRLILLQGSPFLKGLDFPFILALAPLFTWQNFQSNSVVFDSDIDRPPLLLIESGSLFNLEDKQFTRVVGLKILAAHHFRGLVANETLRAGPEGCRLLQADGRVFFDLLQEMPEIALQLLAMEEK